MLHSVSIPLAAAPDVRCRLKESCGYRAHDSRHGVSIGDATLPSTGQMLPNIVLGADYKDPVVKTRRLQRRDTYAADLKGTTPVLENSRWRLFCLMSCRPVPWQRIREGGAKRLVNAELRAGLDRYDAARRCLSFAERRGDSVGAAPLPFIEGVLVYLEEPVGNPLGLGGRAAVSLPPLL
jgi:hypothetical protein